MSIKVLTLVWERSPYQGAHLLAMLAMADAANDRGVFWHSVKELGKKSRMAPSWVREMAHDIERDGFLTRHYRPGRSNVYEINIPALERLPKRTGTPADFRIGEADPTAIAAHPQRDTPPPERRTPTAIAAHTPPPERRDPTAVAVPEPSLNQHLTVDEPLVTNSARARMREGLPPQVAHLIPERGNGTELDLRRWLDSEFGRMWCQQEGIDRDTRHRTLLRHAYADWIAWMESEYAS